MPGGRAGRLQRPRRRAVGPRELGEAQPAHDRRHLPARHQGPRRGAPLRRAGLHDHPGRPRRPRGGRGDDRRGPRLDHPGRERRGRRRARGRRSRAGRADHPDDALGRRDRGHHRPAATRSSRTITSPKSDDICYATTNRQLAVKQLARECDLVLVVGSKNSSNSNRLVDVTRELGTASYLIDNAGEVEEAWLEGVDTVGITSGASAPEELVTELVEFFRDRGTVRRLRAAGDRRGRPLHAAEADPRRAGRGRRRLISEPSATGRARRERQRPDPDLALEVEPHLVQAVAVVLRKLVERRAVEAWRSPAGSPSTATETVPAPSRAAQAPPPAYSTSAARRARSGSTAGRASRRGRPRRSASPSPGRRDRTAAGRGSARGARGRRHRGARRGPRPRSRGRRPRRSGPSAACRRGPRGRSTASPCSRRRARSGARGRWPRETAARAGARRLPAPRPSAPDRTAANARRAPIRPALAVAIVQAGDEREACGSPLSSPTSKKWTSSGPRAVSRSPATGSSADPARRGGKRGQCDVVSAGAHRGAGSQRRHLGRARGYARRPAVETEERAVRETVWDRIEAGPSAT